MRWHYLGHAMWLLELGEEGTRVLFDPLLHDVHDDGLSSVSPRRELACELLRPDFVVVSHRHPDHFDVDSLAWLAAIDPECVVLTSDELVAAVCRRLSFVQVRVLGLWEQVELCGGTLTTTPSYGTCVEWGVAVSSADGVVWNHVDSVLGSANQAERTLEVLRGAAGQGVNLHLARWCPVLEVSAQLAGRIGFPRGTYAELLQGLAVLASEPTCFAPAAVSVVPLAPNDALASNAFPVTRAQFARDLSALSPNARLLDLNVGDTLTVERGVTQRWPGKSPYVRAVDGGELPTFVPFEVAPLRDPWPCPSGDAVARIRNWLENELGPQLSRLSGEGQNSLPVALCLDLRSGDKPYGSVGEACARSAASWTLLLTVGSWSLQPGIDPSYDQLVAVSLGGLLRVLDGVSSWGELLLSGQLRCSDRAYRVVHGQSGGALERISWLPALFVYSAPGYEESFETATWRRVDDLRRKGKGQ
ncbi:MAG: MBL fold metallo-hydrolase [Polyangiaceae bacterium]|nr:MBL fold metallo-hydrolase [Polyangiaceae bacterium]